MVQSNYNCLVISKLLINDHEYFMRYFILIKCLLEEFDKLEMNTIE